MTPHCMLIAWIESHEPDVIKVRLLLFFLYDAHSRCAPSRFSAFSSFISERAVLCRAEVIFQRAER